MVHHLEFEPSLRVQPKRAAVTGKDNGQIALKRKINLDPRIQTVNVLMPWLYINEKFLYNLYIKK